MSTSRQKITGIAVVDEAFKSLYGYLNKEISAFSDNIKNLVLFKRNIEEYFDTYFSNAVKLTKEGGIAVKLINKTGGVSVAGEVVTPSSSYENAVSKIVVDAPNPVGAIYNNGVPDGGYMWVVVAGIAHVYFVGSTTRGYIARGFLTSDGASYVSGRAISEPYPVSPFATDKHFYEIGHLIESRTGAGLAKAILHFN